MLLSVYGNMIYWLEQHQLPCLFKTAFHFDCPGCGFQRSAVALLKGEFTESAKLYPALLPMLLFFVFLFINRKLQLRNSGFYIKTGIATVFIIIAVSYIYKLFI